MASTSSDESYVSQKSRPKRYSKVRNGKLPEKTKQNKSRSSSSNSDVSLSSCGNRGQPSSEPATPNNRKCKTVTPSSCTILSDTSYLINSPTVSLPKSLRTSLPSSLGNKKLVISERQKRWQIVAEENKELLEKVDFSHYNSVKDSPLLKSFRKRKLDPEFRRSLNRPSKAIKVFSDEEEDTKLSKSSNDFPFNKAYDDYFRNLKLFDSDEEFNNWLNDTKGKKSKSAYKRRQLSDEDLLPLDSTKMLNSE